MNDVEFLIMKRIYIYLIRHFGVWYRCVFLRVVPYFDEPVGRVKYKLRVKILSDTTNLNVL